MPALIRAMLATPRRAPAAWLVNGGSQPSHPLPNGDCAIGPGRPGPGTPKGPKRPEDTTDAGDAKDDRGEDNQQRKPD